MGLSFSASAQDLHFSQFFHAPLNLSPALTGVFEGDMRFVANYRSQWSSVPVPYQTFSGAHDQKFYHSRLPNGFIGAGLVFNYDKAGDAELSWTQLGLNVAYTHRLADENFLTAGFQALTGQRAFDPKKLYFDDQFNGDIFDENLSTLEGFANTSRGYLDMAAGLNWFFLDDDSRSRFTGGFALSHLTQPAVGFLDDDRLRLPRRAHAYGVALVQIHPQMDVRAQALYQFQGPYREIVLGGGLKYHVPGERENLALLAGFSHRLNDALVANLEIYFRNWIAGISYDINTSAFSAATNRNGGPEFSLQYIITRVKPPDTFKACPIF